MGTRVNFRRSAPSSSAATLEWWALPCRRSKDVKGRVVQPAVMTYGPGLAVLWVWGGFSSVAADRPLPKQPRMPDAKEAEQIERAQKGDRGAFGALVRTHQRRVFACALQMLGDAGEAEDSTQETFLRAWRAIARFDRRSELSTWLYRICVNVCLNALRRRRRVDAQDISDPRVPEPAADPTQGQTDPRGS